MSNKIPYLLKRPDDTASKTGSNQKATPAGTKQHIVIKNRKIAALLQK